MYKEYQKSLQKQANHNFAFHASLCGIITAAALPSLTKEVAAGIIVAPFAIIGTREILKAGLKIGKPILSKFQKAFRALTQRKKNITQVIQPTANSHTQIIQVIETHLSRTVADYARKLDIPKTPYVKLEESNALVACINPRTNEIRISPALGAALSVREIDSILAHEVGHAALCRLPSKYSLMASFALIAMNATFIKSMPMGVVAGATIDYASLALTFAGPFLFMRYIRNEELLADKYSVLLTQSTDLITATRKLRAYNEPQNKTLRSFKEKTEKFLDVIFHPISTHPTDEARRRSATRTAKEFGL